MFGRSCRHQWSEPLADEKYDDAMPAPASAIHSSGDAGGQGPRLPRDRRVEQNCSDSFDGEHGDDSWDCVLDVFAEGRHERDLCVELGCAGFLGELGQTSLE
jgi:hypothetical protein